MRRSFDKRESNFIAKQARPSDLYTREFHRPERNQKKKSRTRAVVKFIKNLFRKPAPWELELIREAKEKRARRRARNIMWWANDLTWAR